jgi:hypothetical protein
MLDIIALQSANNATALQSANNATVRQCLRSKMSMEERQQFLLRPVV